MAKIGMIKVEAELLKKLSWSTNIKSTVIGPKYFGVSTSGFLKWIRTGVIPINAFHKLIVLNKFQDYKIEENPTVSKKGQDRKADFKLIDFFGTKSGDLFVEVKSDSRNLESAIGQVNTLDVPTVMLHLDGDDVVAYENHAMLSRLKNPKGSKPNGQRSIQEVSLDDLLKEIEQRGWSVKLERQSLKTKTKRRS